MSRQRPELPFLERQTYRRRRLMDAARLLPVLGAVLLALPLLWAGPDGDMPESAASTARGGIYVFAVWTGLIVCAVLIGRPLARTDAPEPRDMRRDPPAREPGGTASADGAAQKEAPRR